MRGSRRLAGLGLDKVEVRCDARLVVEQVTGRREPANPRLRGLCEAARATTERIGSVVFTWVPSAANGQAHALVAEALAPAPMNAPAETDYLVVGPGPAVWPSSTRWWPKRTSR